MERITEKMLQLKVDYLNKITGNPAESWTKDDDGRFHANIGNYHISSAYGGVSLEQMCTDGGGVHSVFGIGHVPKRELYNRLCAYINGYEDAKND